MNDVIDFTKFHEILIQFTNSGKLFYLIHFIPDDVTR